MSAHTFDDGPVAWQKFGKEYCLTGQYGMRPIILSVSPKGQLMLRDRDKDRLIPFSPDHPDAMHIIDALNGYEKVRAMLGVVLDQVDYTAGACRVNEMVGAVLPKAVIEQARALLKP